MEKALPVIGGPFLCFDAIIMQSNAMESLAQPAISPNILEPEA